MEHEMLDIGTVRATGNAPADAALRAVVAAFAAAFPGRIRSCYILGSYADASAVATSDLDVIIIFKGRLSLQERAMVAQLAATCAERRDVELDIEVDDEETLTRGASPNFKLGSALIWGEDIRERTPLVSLAEWTRDRMHSSWWRIARLFDRPEVITLPLVYPESADPFRGYTRRTVRSANGEDVPCTRDLIRLTGWAATALLAFQSGIYVVRKSEAHRLYHEHIGGEWARLIEETFTLCRMRWGYLIPAAPEERKQLRKLCDQTLGFERYFTAIYREYLLTELRSNDPEAARFAAEVMSRAPLSDGAVMTALDALALRGDTTIEPLARSALAQLRKPASA